MLIDWLESFCDRFVPRISSEGASDRVYDQQDFEKLIQRLVRERKLRTRVSRHRMAVLELKGKFFGNMTKEVPKLRYKLCLRDDGRLDVSVFEHVLCFSKSPQAKALRELFEKHLRELLDHIEDADSDHATENPPEADSA